jgi:hypothetical protein
MLTNSLLCKTSLNPNSLEENWIETVESMKQMDDDQWKSLNIPMGLVNQIKSHLLKIG